jgi:anti-anti-sigma factor
MAYRGIRDRRIGAITVIDADADVRIGLKFGARLITLSEAVQSLLDDGRDQILVNLEQVPSIGDRGLAELVLAAAVTNRKGGRFKLAHLNGTVLETIRKAQLLTYLDVFEVESQALDSFTSSLSQISSTQISS